MNSTRFTFAKKHKIVVSHEKSLKAKLEEKITWINRKYRLEKNANRE